MRLYQQQNILLSFEKAIHGNYDKHYRVGDYHDDWHAMHDCIRYDEKAFRSTLSLLKRDLVYFEIVGDEPRKEASLVCFATELGERFYASMKQNIIYDFDEDTPSIGLTRKAYRELIDTGCLSVTDIEMFQKITHPDLEDLRREVVLKKLIGNKSETGYLVYE